MRRDWTIKEGMWLCPNCHQYSAVVCAWVVDDDKNPGLDCPVCGWTHVASQWCKVRCPEGCLTILGDWIHSI